MTNKELDALFERIEEAVSRVNAGETTLESVASEFGLVMHPKLKQYLHPRWGWPIMFDEQTKQYCLYY